MLLYDEDEETGDTVTSRMFSGKVSSANDTSLPSKHLYEEYGSVQMLRRVSR